MEGLFGGVSSAGRWYPPARMDPLAATAALPPGMGGAMDAKPTRMRPVGPSGSLPRAARRAAIRPAGTPAEVVDRLGALTDRDDLARLFERNVDLPTIVRLAGRRVPRETIRRILESPDPPREARRILD